MWKINWWNSVEDNFTVIAIWTKWEEIWQKRIFNIEWWKTHSILEIATDRLSEIPMAVKYWYVISSIMENTKGKTWKIIYQKFSWDEV
jgi:hypothetical protein